jgi:hypothetical protein
MPFFLVHAGNALFAVNPATGAAQTVTLPAGVTLSTTLPARFATLNSEVVVTNAPSINIVMNALDFSTRVLSIAGPGASVPTVAAGGAGNLSGEYRYKVTFAILGSGSIVLTESPFSDATSPITVDSKTVNLSSIPVSATTGVNARRIYRTTNGGVDYFLLTTISDNSTTTFADNLTDYDLALLPTADTLGNPPGFDTSDYLSLIVSWKDRLWAAPHLHPDSVYYCENRKIWGWGALQFVTVKPVGADPYGVTAFLVRRDDLLVGKRGALWMIRGTPPDTIQVIQLFEGPGPLGQGAAIVIHDDGYYLGEDGFYKVSGTGVQRISEQKAHPWFTTDDFFNRSKFPDAFANWNPQMNTIELHLAAAGSSNIDRWVSYDLRTTEWLGPHKTGAFTPTTSALVQDANGFAQPIMCSSAGFIYTENSTTYSDDGTAIDYDVISKFHAAETPDIQKYFGELGMITKIEGAGTLTITPKVGGLNASAGAAISHDLTLGRQRLRRLGTGRFAQLRFQQASNNQGVEIYGYEIEYHELGRR